MSKKVSHKIQKAMKIRLVPLKEQENFFNINFGCARLIYNLNVADRLDYWNQVKDLPKEQRPKYEKKTPKQWSETTDKNGKPLSFLKDANQQALCNSSRNCDKAFNNFFKSIKKERKGKPVGAPNFKSKNDHRDSFSNYMLAKNCLDWEHRLVYVSGCGWVKFCHAEDKKGKWLNWFKTATPKNMTISSTPSREIWCSILFEKEEDTITTVNLSSAIGLDFSPEHLYVDSKNNIAPYYVAVKQEYKNKKKEKKLRRRLARKQKGSNSYGKAKTKLAKHEQHIADKRKDYIEKETLRLVQTYDVIGIEDLNLQGMMKFSHNAKNYLDASWGNFVQKLEWKAQFNNCVIIKADRFYPSSKTCNHCSYIKKDLKLSDRVWVCPNCGETIIRDSNAGQNLRDNAIKTIVEGINSTLLLEQQNVMSVEGIEVQYINGILCGVSYETERLSSNT